MDPCVNHELDPHSDHAAGPALGARWEDEALPWNPHCLPNTCLLETATPGAAVGEPQRVFKSLPSLSPPWHRKPCFPVFCPALALI